MTAIDRHMQEMAQRIADLRRPQDFDFGFTKTEATKTSTLIEATCAYWCRNCHVELPGQPSKCIHCGCQIIDGIPF